MSNEQDDKLNRLLGRRGSIAERTRIAKELDDDRLQMVAPYSPQAKEEIGRRRHESLLASARNPMTSEEELQKLIDQLDLLRFVETSEGLVLKADDQTNFQQITLEATSLLYGGHRVRLAIFAQVLLLCLCNARLTLDA